jgi:hypothetical protein
MKEIQEDTKDGKISCAHGLAELILWKWLYYKEWPIDSMQFPWKFQYHYSQK